MSILLDVMAKQLEGGRGGVRTPQAGAGILLFPFVLEFNDLTVTNRTLGLHFYINLCIFCVPFSLQPKLVNHLIYLQASSWPRFPRGI